MGNDHLFELWSELSKLLSVKEKPSTPSAVADGATNPRADSGDSLFANLGKKTPAQAQDKQPKQSDGAAPQPTNRPTAHAADGKVAARYEAICRRHDALSRKISAATPVSAAPAAVTKINGAPQNGNGAAASFTAPPTVLKSPKKTRADALAAAYFALPVFPEESAKSPPSDGEMPND